MKNIGNGAKIIDPNAFKMFSKPDLVDILEGFVIVDFVPTSENLSKWLLGIAQKKMAKLGVKVASLQFFETPKSQSHFIA